MTIAWQSDPEAELLERLILSRFDHPASAKIIGESSQPSDLSPRIQRVLERFTRADFTADKLPHHKGFWA